MIVLNIDNIIVHEIVLNDKTRVRTLYFYFRVESVWIRNSVLFVIGHKCASYNNIRYYALFTHVTHSNHIILLRYYIICLCARRHFGPLLLF